MSKLIHNQEIISVLGHMVASPLRRGVGDVTG